VTEPKKPCSGSLGLHHSNRPFFVCTKFAPNLHNVHHGLSKFVFGLIIKEVFFWGKYFFDKNANPEQTFYKLFHFEQT
jgi:hypothetical protein